MIFPLFVARHLATALLLSAAAGSPSTTEPPAAPTDAGTEPRAVPPAGQSSSGAQARIENLRQLVARDPTDAKAWIALGNEYFDSAQREKAVEAYGKALELQPNNPDVLTDQGVMYRELGAFKKAIANFRKAGKIDPRHTQSMLDLGVLYAQDLKDYDKAMKTWNHLIQVAPGTPAAAKAREYIEQLKHRPKPK